MLLVRMGWKNIEKKRVKAKKLQSIVSKSSVNSCKRWDLKLTELQEKARASLLDRSWFRGWVRIVT